MIKGHVLANLDAVVRLVALGPSEIKHEAEFVVDTGYDGDLQLPAKAISELKLAWYCDSDYTLADGSTVAVARYRGWVLWDGAKRAVLVDRADADPLLGVNLLKHHRLTIDFISGGGVSITPL